MNNPLTQVGINAKDSARVLSQALTQVKNQALLSIATALRENTSQIVAANKLDMQYAKENNITSAMQDRLMLDPQRIDSIALAVEEVANLPDPVGQVINGTKRPNGLEITNISVPLGVIGLIYEARPNVTVDCAVLCLKSGNACILRGGSEAIHSNKILADILRDSLEKSGLPKDSVQLIEDTSREYATALMQLDGYVDALIPRGGKGLIKSVVANATVPVIETGAGLCHIYVDDSANLKMALDIVDNAKTSRPSVCNAVETLLVHKNVADEFIPQIVDRLTTTQLYGCEDTKKIGGQKIHPATEENWATEYNDFIMNIKIVDDLNMAVRHINKYSTNHSEAIVTESYESAQSFINQVDAASVYVNASTRFTDGGEFGLGAEIGISTQKLHVRGPMGLKALTSNKFVVRGNGQIR